MTSPLRALLSLAGLAAPLLALAACKTTGAGAGGGAGSAPAASTLDPRLARTEIVTLEDRRSDGDGRLVELARHTDADVRARALTALGRLPHTAYGASVTDALCAGLHDAEPGVRESAAFALGLRADPDAEVALRDACADPDERVRAAVVEAASKIGTALLREQVLRALDDASARVQREAAVGPHRWAGEERARIARLVDTALVDAAREEGGAADPEFVWRVLFSLQRRASGVARDFYLEHARDEQVLARLFAVKGLAQLEPDVRGDTDELRAALEHALLDDDWRVTVEALRGLGELASPRSVDALERTLGHPSAHVRAATFEALGHQGRQGGRITGLLERARVDRSSSVRAAALVAEARVRGAELAPDLELKMTSKDPILRAACARAAEQLPSELAVPYLATLARDRNMRVATTAVEVLGLHPTPAAREVLLDMLQGRDNGKRLAAVIALRAASKPEDVAALRRAFERSRDDIAGEVKFNCLLSAEEIGTDEALAFVREALEDDSPYVRQVAYEILERADDTPGSCPDLTCPEPNVVEAEAEAETTNPIVEISTNRGLMTFELFPAEAPVHVRNFLELAAADHYDGLNFHRVVPDFVIQGGCYRGDGNGARPWQGEALRHEIGPRKYVRGSLGMPRNQDMESGGSQFFVTHRPTPHLDGRYTIFGELRSGGLVLDSIEVGDVILDVRPLEP